MMPLMSRFCPGCSYLNISLCIVARIQYDPLADALAFAWSSTEYRWATAMVTPAMLVGVRSVPSASMSVSGWESTEKRKEAKEPVLNRRRR